MRGAVTGTHGLIGKALLARLESRGDDVIRLVRHDARGTKDVLWNPGRGVIDASRLESLDYVVHLAGANIGVRPWTRERRRDIWRSRTEGTALLARTLAELRAPPATLLSASAIGYYGDAGDAILTEESPRGTGFRADVCHAWEAAAAPASRTGLRVAFLRSAIVVSRRGGLLPYLMRLPFAPRFGSGRQFWSWISIDDEIEAIIHVLEHQDISGPLNLTAPTPVRQEAIARAIGEATGRPVVGIPAVVLAIGLGPQRAHELLLSSERAIPKRLLDSGFAFRHADVRAALRPTDEKVTR